MTPTNSATSTHWMMPQRANETWRFFTLLECLDSSDTRVFSDVGSDSFVVAVAVTVIAHVVAFCLTFCWRRFTQTVFLGLHHFCFLFLNLNCMQTMQTYYFTTLFYYLFFYFFFFLFFFFVVVHRSSSSVLSFCVFFFFETLTNAQFHTNIHKYVKYIAQSCCESVMAFFLFFSFLLSCI